MGTEPLNHAQLLLGNLIHTDIGSQLADARETISSKSGKFLSKEDLDDRLITLIDFYDALINDNCQNLPTLADLAKLLIDLKISPKHAGLIDQESVGLVNKLIKVGHRHLGDGDDVSETIGMLIAFAKKHDVSGNAVFAELRNQFLRQR
jgi:hypothetical protein